jgi:hypothetical protein
MKKFQFKKKIEEEKELNKFESSLKNLSEKEISNLKSKYEDDIFKDMYVVIFLFIVSLYHSYILIDRFFFNLRFKRLKIPLINLEIPYGMEFAFFIFVLFAAIGLSLTREENKKKLEIINKLNNEKVSINK